ncbi:hypothetical protein [Pseudoflavonifractor phocaeensis]|uniref:hypothetical protein n=1 Tax=Pseudoflavonifractor phocaeensis TaxID=1870988 RepID=UPI001F2FC2B2|nr:hypothetical protein [Pseudoflavonifractor phocaeensis]MCF2662925.1 hypothetical protein [Pseudoflavonifractor phocaeensis]
MAGELTREQALELILGRPVPCPACGKAALLPLHKSRQQNTRFQCPACRAVFRPTRLI